MVIGINVDSIKDKNSNDWAINEGKNSTGNNIPTKIDFEKSGLGKNNNPINSIETINVFRFEDGIRHHFALTTQGHCEKVTN